MLKTIKMSVGVCCFTIALSASNVFAAVVIDPVVILAQIVGAAQVNPPVGDHQSCSDVLSSTSHDHNLNSYCHTCIGFLSRESELEGLDFNAGFSLVQNEGSSESLIYCVGNLNSNVDQLSAVWEKKLKNNLGSENADCFSDTVAGDGLGLKFTACLFE